MFCNFGEVSTVLFFSWATLPFVSFYAKPKEPFVTSKMKLQVNKYQISTQITKANMLN